MSSTHRSLFRVLVTLSLVTLLSHIAAAQITTAPDRLQTLSLAYYSAQGDWDSTLTLNNAIGRPLSVSVTLYSLDGSALTLPEVALNPSGTVVLHLSESLSKLQAKGKFQEGSIELRYTGPHLAIGAQLTVLDLKHGLSFDMEPPAEEFKSSTLEGLWWSPDEKTSGLVMLSNTINQELSVTLNLEWKGATIATPLISLSSHQTRVTQISQLLEEQGIHAEGIGLGGISLIHNGTPGALLAQGVILNKEAHFASNLNFVDPAAQKSTAFEGTGLLVGRPSAASAFGAGSFFTPQLALKNATGSTETVTVTVQYTVNGQFQSKTLPAIDLAPHDVRKVDFSDRSIRCVKFR